VNRWLVALVCCAVWTVQAQSIKAGRYIRSGGTAVMDIGASSIKRALDFDIEVIGGNAHLCGLSGQIVAGKTKTDRGCVIDFGYREGVVTVTPRNETLAQCQEHCGMRAWFAGDYEQEPELCGQLKTVKKQFAKDYVAQNYAKAQTALFDFVKTCDRFVRWNDMVPLRNDLAITEFHLGNKATCLSALEPVSSIFIDLPLDDVMGGEPAFRDEGLKLAKTSRFNWKKCGGSVAPATER
jgi:hypothetical protein